MLFKFTKAEHEEYGSAGWRMKGTNLDPLPGMGTAHDILEHFGEQHISVDSEFRALGASLWVRKDYAASKGLFITDQGAHIAGRLPRHHAPRSPRRGALDRTTCYSRRGRGRRMSDQPSAVQVQEGGQGRVSQRRGRSLGHRRRRAAAYARLDEDRLSRRRGAMHEYLYPYFTVEQLYLIESAFERNMTGVLQDVSKHVRAKEFAVEEDSADTRMRLIMKNVIKNKGVFVP